MAGVYKYFSSSKSNPNFRPSSKFAGGSVREDMKRIIELGRFGIHEAIIQADVILSKYIDKILPFKPVYKGKLRNNWGHKLMKKGGEVYSKTDYGHYIDEGTSPHMPPYKPIAEWVAAKTGAPKSFVKEAANIAFSAKGKSKLKRRKKPGQRFPTFKKRFKGSKRASAVKAFAAIVLGTRLKIKSRGIKARDFVNQAIPELADDTVSKVLKNIDDNQATGVGLPLSMSLRQSTTSFSSERNGKISASSSTVTE